MKIHFDSAEVAAQVRHALRSPQHRPTFCELNDPKLHKGGVVKIGEHGFPDAENLDLAKVPPALWLVKDQGIYLMSNGTPRFLLDPDDTDLYARGRVAYAHGFNPALNTDWYDRLGILAGDDFSAALPVSLFAKAEAPETRSIFLSVTKNHITVL